jgi:Carboxypeptidase regulatory-like domain/TonB dependent receptor-like, beta-barrel
MRNVLVLAVVLVVVMSAVPVGAQTGSTIHGTVTDASGAALPGVVVTLTSPALQVGQDTTVTGPDGTYRFGDLPTGVYRVTFELAGFKTFVRNELRLPIGFIARVDVGMEIGGIEESVTVSGAAPVVDLTSTTTSVNLTRDTLETIPAGRGYQHLFAMTPGVTTGGAPDVGDSSLASRNPIQAYGVASTAKMDVEGMNISVGESSGVYFQTYSFEEIQIKTSGNDAEVSTPGISMVSVLKSGSNQFHGSYIAAYQGPRFESSNLTDQLRAQGLSATSPLRYYYEYAADLGGRIIRDKLWFFVATSKQQRVSGILGFAAAPGADGKYLTADDPLADYENNLTSHAVKVSYQATQKNRLIGVWQPMLKYQPQRDGARFRPLESTTDYRNPGGIYKGELQSTVTNRIVANVNAGYGGNRADYSSTRSKVGAAVPGNPSRLDRETGLRTGSSEHNNKGYSDRWQVDAGVSFFPEKFLGGRHEMKTGTTMYWERGGEGKTLNPAGDYVLVYDRVGGVSNQPVEIQIFNAPNQPINWNHKYAAYIKDTWRATDRLTLNLGVRFEYQHAFLPEQSKPVTPGFPTLFPAGTFPYLSVQKWYSTVPRFGLAWSLASATVLKASYGRYNGGMESGFAGVYNANGQSTATFRWTDPDGNKDYTPGEVNLNLNNNPDFINISAASNNLLAPDLRQPMTNEVTAGIEHELMPNLGIRALYVYKDFNDQIATTNVRRPREAYSIPLTRRDPGPDGVLNNADDAGTVTIWDYSPAYAGAAFVANQRQNSPLVDKYQSLELTVTKRSSGRWFGMGSFWVTKHHRNLSPIPDNPNNDYFNVAEQWTWASNLSGSYRLPWDVQFAAFLQSKVGVQGLRTNIFRATDPDGGPPLRQLTTVTLRLEPFGEQQGPAITLLNLRASKIFTFAGRHRFEVNVDAFNLLNSSAPTTMTFASGPTFGWYGSAAGTTNAAETGIVAARVGRIGIRYSF